jgi:hypothetical protein
VKIAKNSRDHREPQGTINFKFIPHLIYHKNSKTIQKFIKTKKIIYSPKKLENLISTQLFNCPQNLMHFHRLTRLPSPIFVYVDNFFLYHTKPDRDNLLSSVMKQQQQAHRHATKPLLKCRR